VSPQSAYRPGGSIYDLLRCRSELWRFGIEKRAGERSELLPGRVSALPISQTSGATASENSFPAARLSSNGETISNRTDASGGWRGSKRPEQPVAPPRCYSVLTFSSLSRVDVMDSSTELLPLIHAPPSRKRSSGKGPRSKTSVTTVASSPSGVRM